MPGTISEFHASPESIIAYVMISAVYLSLVVVATLSSRVHELRLISIGLLTAVAAIGYGALVSGGAILVSPMLMKIAFLLILGGLATRLIQSQTLPSDGAAEVQTDA